MKELILAAHDAEDLEVISARLQDAVARVGDLVYLKKQHRFAGMFNRFAWETENKDMRIRTGVHFDGVLSVRCHKLCQQSQDAVVELLAIRFTPRGGNDPAGTVELVFAGGGALQLDVECLEAAMADEGESWEALGRPEHKVED